MKNIRLQLLFKKHIADRLTAEEAEELQGYVDDREYEPMLKNSIREEFTHFAENNDAAEVQVDQIVEDLENKVLLKINGLPTKNIFHFPHYWRYAAAAAIIVMAGTMIYWSAGLMKKAAGSSIAATVKDIGPGKNKAILTLANGESIVLSEKMAGITLRDNQICYDNGLVLFKNVAGQSFTLTVPRAGKYKVVLSDGTRVWLNAASSISTTGTFKGNERIVEVKGETYFEVTHDSKHPFIVKSAGQRVKVLGTAFNVNAYSADSSVTTLISGRINLHALKGTQKILKPGDQAIVGKDSFHIGKVDADNFITWKDDLIVLDDQKIHEIFKQLERWYDVEFVNMEIIDANKTLSGEIPRNIALPVILKAIENQLHVTFKVNGRRIMIKS